MHPEVALVAVAHQESQGPHLYYVTLCCSIIFCEAVAIYGVIVAIILQTKIDYVDADKTTGLYPIPAMTAGYAIFGSGITTGWANLACGCVLHIQSLS